MTRCASRPISRRLNVTNNIPKQQIETTVPLRFAPVFHASLSRRPYVSPNVSFARELMSEEFGPLTSDDPVLVPGFMLAIVLRFAQVC
jgi:hypothetical protein